jgi:hypothetical protein
MLSTSLDNELDPDYSGFAELTITNEDVLSILEGTADELMILDYKSLSNLSAPTVHKMYSVVMVVCGQVGPALSKRYSELWAEE